MMKKIVLLQHYFNVIGGVETFLINFCKTFYKQYDITLICRDISNGNKSILEQYITVLTEPTDIECDKCIITSVLVDLETFSRVKYKEVYQMIHSDWKAMQSIWEYKYQETDPDMKFIAVSDIARQSFVELFGHNSLVIPNIVKKADKKVLKLCSATRLSEEKGLTRMNKLADMLHEQGIPFVWDIYTNRNADIKEGMYLKKPIQQLSSLFGMYDYIVQLSDTESFCYTMYEALTEGVPVIVTPFPNAIQEIKDGKNGYIVPFDMKFNVKKLLNVPKGFEYKQEGVEKLWTDLLDKKEPKQKYVKIKFIKPVRDKYLQIKYHEGLVKEFKEGRAKELLELKDANGNNVCEVIK